MRSKTIPKLKTLMTPFPYTIDAGEGIPQAVELMETHSIHHLPVTDDSELVGIISDRDVIVVQALGKKLVEQVVVGDLVHGELCCMDLNTPLNLVTDALLERKIGSVLVTREEKLVGIFTLTDACKCLGEFFDIFFPHSDYPSAS